MITKSLGSTVTRPLTALELESIGYDRVNLKSDPHVLKILSFARLSTPPVLKLMVSDKPDHQKGRADLALLSIGELEEMAKNIHEHITVIRFTSPRDGSDSYVVWSDFNRETASRGLHRFDSVDEAAHEVLRLAVLAVRGVWVSHVAA